MIAPAASVTVGSLLEDLSARFQEVMPRIERHARIYFRHVVCPDRKADYIAETVAVAWNWFVRLAERGKDASTFVSALATLAARAVHSGRKVCGFDSATDVLSRVAQRRHGFAVNRFSDLSTVASSPIEEALVENTVTPPNEQAAFRIDFARWLGGYDERDRRIMDDLIVGERPKDVSKKYRISRGRVSQKRRAFHRDWCEFHGEGEDNPAQNRVCVA